MTYYCTCIMLYNFVIVPFDNLLKLSKYTLLMGTTWLPFVWDHSLLKEVIIPLPSPNVPWQFHFKNKVLNNWVNFKRIWFFNNTLYSVPKYHRLLNYSILLNTSVFKRCAFKSMKHFQDFFTETPPLAYHVSIHAYKMWCLPGLCIATDQDDNG